MAKGIILTEDDHAILKEMIGQFLQQRENASAVNPLGFLHRSPEVHIVYPGTEYGIPARDGDNVGSALCYFCKIILVSGSPKLATTPTVRRVYNLSPSALPQDYVTAQRDAAGNWMVSSQSEGILIVEGTLVTTLEYHMLSVMLEGVQSIDGRDIEQYLDENNQLEVGTEFQWEADEGAKAWAIRWPRTNNFRLLQVDCPSTPA